MALIVFLNILKLWFPTTSPISGGKEEGGYMKKNRFFKHAVFDALNAVAITALSGAVAT